jgi:phosphoribosylglycinamide formyltransferase-1
MKRIAVFASGGGTNLQALIDAVDKGEITNGRIEIVFSNKSDSFALERARRHGIPTLFLNPKEFTDREAYDKELADKMNSLKIDLVCLAGYMKIFTGAFVNGFKGKIMNIHPALLPSYGGKGMYGLHVHEAVLAHKEKTTGVTVHFADCGTDTGPIILQKKVPVDGAGTPEELQKKVLAYEYLAYKEAVNLFCNDRLVIEGSKVKVLE